MKAIHMFRVHPAQAHSERGATMLEYGLVITLIAIAVILAAGLFGTGVAGLFENGVAAL